MNVTRSSLLNLCEELPVEFQKNLPSSILKEDNLEKVEKKIKVVKILMEKEKNSPAPEIIQKIFGFNKNENEQSIHEEINSKLENKQPEEPMKENKEKNDFENIKNIHEEIMETYEQFQKINLEKRNLISDIYPMNDVFYDDLKDQIDEIDEYISFVREDDFNLVTKNLLDSKDPCSHLVGLLRNELIISKIDKEIKKDDFNKFTEMYKIKEEKIEQKEVNASSNEQKTKENSKEEIFEEMKKSIDFNAENIPMNSFLILELIKWKQEYPFRIKLNILFKRLLQMSGKSKFDSVYQKMKDLSEHFPNEMINEVFPLKGFDEEDMLAFSIYKIIKNLLYPSYITSSLIGVLISIIALMKKLKSKVILGKDIRIVRLRILDFVHVLSGFLLDQKTEKEPNILNTFNKTKWRPFCDVIPYCYSKEYFDKFPKLISMLKGTVNWYLPISPISSEDSIEVLCEIHAAIQYEIDLPLPVDDYSTIESVDKILPSQKKFDITKVINGKTGRTYEIDQSLLQGTTEELQLLILQITAHEYSQSLSDDLLNTINDDVMANKLNHLYSELILNPNIKKSTDHPINIVTTYSIEILQQLKRNEEDDIVDNLTSIFRSFESSIGYFLQINPTKRKNPFNEEKMKMIVSLFDKYIETDPSKRTVPNEKHPFFKEMLKNYLIERVDESHRQPYSFIPFDEQHSSHIFKASREKEILNEIKKRETEHKEKMNRNPYDVLNDHSVHFKSKEIWMNNMLKTLSHDSIGSNFSELEKYCLNLLNSDEIIPMNNNHIYDIIFKQLELILKENMIFSHSLNVKDKILNETDQMKLLQEIVEKWKTRVEFSNYVPISHKMFEVKNKETIGTLQKHILEKSEFVPNTKKSKIDQDLILMFKNRMTQEISNKSKEEFFKIQDSNEDDFELGILEPGLLFQKFLYKNFNLKKDGNLDKYIKIVIPQLKTVLDKFSTIKKENDFMVKNWMEKRNEIMKKVDSLFNSLLRICHIGITLDPKFMYYHFKKVEQLTKFHEMTNNLVSKLTLKFEQNESHIIQNKEFNFELSKEEKEMWWTLIYKVKSDANSNSNTDLKISNFSKQLKEKCNNKIFHHFLFTENLRNFYILLWMSNGYFKYATEICSLFIIAIVNKTIKNYDLTSPYEVISPFFTRISIEIWKKKDLKDSEGMTFEKSMQYLAVDSAKLNLISELKVIFSEMFFLIDSSFNMWTQEEKTNNIIPLIMLTSLCTDVENKNLKSTSKKLIRKIVKYINTIEQPKQLKEFIEIVIRNSMYFPESLKTIFFNWFKEVVENMKLSSKDHCELINSIVNGMSNRQVIQWKTSDKIIKDIMNRYFIQYIEYKKPSFISKRKIGKDFVQNQLLFLMKQTWIVQKLIDQNNLSNDELVCLYELLSKFIQELEIFSTFYKFSISHKLDQIDKDWMKKQNWIDNIANMLLKITFVEQESQLDFEKLNIENIILEAPRMAFDLDLSKEQYFLVLESVSKLHSFVHNSLPTISWLFENNDSMSSLKAFFQFIHDFSYELEFKKQYLLKSGKKWNDNCFIETWKQKLKENHKYKETYKLIQQSSANNTVYDQQLESMGHSFYSKIESEYFIMFQNKNTQTMNELYQELSNKLEEYFQNGDKGLRLDCLLKIKEIDWIISNNPMAFKKSLSETIKLFMWDFENLKEKTAPLWLFYDVQKRLDIPNDQINETLDLMYNKYYLNTKPLSMLKPPKSVQNITNEEHIGQIDHMVSKMEKSDQHICYSIMKFSGMYMDILESLRITSLKHSKSLETYLYYGNYVKPKEKIIGREYEFCQRIKLQYKSIYKVFKSKSIKKEKVLLELYQIKDGLIGECDDFYNLLLKEIEIEYESLTTKDEIENSEKFQQEILLVKYCVSLLKKITKLKSEKKSIENQTQIHILSSKYEKSKELLSNLKKEIKRQKPYEKILEIEKRFVKVKLNQYKYELMNEYSSEIEYLIKLFGESTEERNFHKQLENHSFFQKCLKIVQEDSVQMNNVFDIDFNAKLKTFKIFNKPIKQEGIIKIIKWELSKDQKRIKNEKILNSLVQHHLSINLVEEKKKYLLSKYHKYIIKIIQLTTEEINEEDQSFLTLSALLFKKIRESTKETLDLPEIIEATKDIQNVPMKRLSDILGFCYDCNSYWNDFQFLFDRSFKVSNNEDSISFTVNQTELNALIEKLRILNDQRIKEKNEKNRLNRFYQLLLDLFGIKPHTVVAFFSKFHKNSVKESRWNDLVKLLLTVGNETRKFKSMENYHEEISELQNFIDGKTKEISPILKLLLHRIEIQKSKKVASDDQEKSPRSTKSKEYVPFFTSDFEKMINLTKPVSSHEFQKIFSKHLNQKLLLDQLNNFQKAIDLVIPSFQNLMKERSKENLDRVRQEMKSYFKWVHIRKTLCSSFCNQNNNHSIEIDKLLWLCELSENKTSFQHLQSVEESIKLNWKIQINKLMLKWKNKSTISFTKNALVHQNTLDEVAELEFLKSNGILITISNDLSINLLKVDSLPEYTEILKSSLKNFLHLKEKLTWKEKCKEYTRSSNINWRVFLWMIKNPKNSKQLLKLTSNGYTFPIGNEELKPLNFISNSHLIDTWKSFETNSLTNYPTIKRRNNIFSTAISWNFLSILLQKMKIVTSHEFQMIFQMIYRLTSHSPENFLIGYNLMKFCANLSIEKSKKNNFELMITCIQIIFSVLLKPYFYENDLILRSETYNLFLVIWIQLIKNFIKKESLPLSKLDIDFLGHLSQDVDTLESLNLKYLKTLFIDIFQVINSLMEKNIHQNHHHNFILILQWYINLIKKTSDKSEWKLILLKKQTNISISLLSILLNPQNSKFEKESTFESKHLIIYKFILSLLFDEYEDISKTTKFTNDLRQKLKGSANLKSIQNFGDEILQMILNSAPISHEGMIEQGLMECFNFLFVVKVFWLIFEKIEYKK
eukprot:gene7844-12317_t